jgi:Restriction endonuclease
MKLIDSLRNEAISRRKKVFSVYTDTDVYTYTPTEEEVKKFYRSSEWLATRRAVLKRDKGFDQIELVDFGRLIPGETVHHIVPLREYWEARLDINNLETTSRRNHNREHIEKGNKKLATKRRAVEELKLTTTVIANDNTEEL